MVDQIRGTSHLKRHNEQCKVKHNVDIRNYMQLVKDECGNLIFFSYDDLRVVNE